MLQDEMQKPDIPLKISAPLAVKQRVGPISYKLYTLFMNYLLHKETPSESSLKEAGLTTSSESDRYDETSNRRQKFLAWAKKMFVRVNSRVDQPEVQIVSLISKRSNKEIVPQEHYTSVIMQLHSKNGQPGQTHLPIHSTISAIKKKYTFGRRDFGMTEEQVRDVVNECDALHCYAKIYCKALPKKSSDTMLFDSNNASFTAKLAAQSPADITKSNSASPFSAIPDSDIAKTLSVSAPPTSLQLLEQVITSDEDSSKFKTVKNATSAKPKEEKTLDTEWSAIMSNVKSLQKELLWTCAGRPLGYERMCRTLTSTEQIVKTCQSLFSDQLTKELR